MQNLLKNITRFINYNQKLSIQNIIEQFQIKTNQANQNDNKSEINKNSDIEKSYSDNANDTSICEEDIDPKNMNFEVINYSVNTEQKINIFGEDYLCQKQKIKSESIYQNLNSWELVHFIIKTGDNLLQEQFALQLINQFDQIFKAENLPLKLHSYEVLSLGPQSGIIEMVKDAITIDSLKQKMYKHSNKRFTLKQFFDYNFPNKKELSKAKLNFCHSLAAYSLVCYILQVKDRHNGNILLHRNGHILHIDFGFFISNAPGQGFEANIPFKMISEYVEVLGGSKSRLFGEFRKLFFKGFKAIRKHQSKILLLIKMMYSGQGQILPCFEGGEQSIQLIHQRINPDTSKIKNEIDLNIHVQNIINQSVDDFRTRWYDKFQYYFQGIFY